MIMTLEPRSTTFVPQSTASLPQFIAFVRQVQDVKAQISISAVGKFLLGEHEVDSKLLRRGSFELPGLSQSRVELAQPVALW